MSKVLSAVVVHQSHRHTLVARRVHLAFVRLGVRERVSGHQFAGFQLNGAESRASAIESRPAVHHVNSALEPPDYGLRGVPDVVAIPVVGRTLVGMTLLFDPENGSVQHAAGTTCSLAKHLRYCSVPVFQRVERQAVLAVLVIEHPCQLVGTALLPPLSKTVGDLPGHLPVFGWRQSVCGRPHQQVEKERDPVAVPDRQHFMRAVGVEGGEGQLGGLHGGQFECGRSARMANDQLAPGAGCRQRQRQGRHHAGSLLGVPVFGEEASRLVDEQLVELDPESFGRQAQTFGDQTLDRREQIRPRPTRDKDILGVDLPTVANRCVQNGFGPLAVGRALRSRNQPLDLRLGHREGQLACTFDDDARHRREEGSADAVVARTLHGLEKFVETPLLRSGLGSVVHCRFPRIERLVETTKSNMDYYN